MRAGNPLGLWVCLIVLTSACISPTPSEPDNAPSTPEGIVEFTQAFMGMDTYAIMQAWVPNLTMHLEPWGEAGTDRELEVYFTAATGETQTSRISLEPEPVPWNVTVAVPETVRDLLPVTVTASCACWPRLVGSYPEGALVNGPRDNVVVETTNLTVAWPAPSQPPSVGIARAEATLELPERLVGVVVYASFGGVGHTNATTPSGRELISIAKDVQGRSTWDYSGGFIPIESGTWTFAMEGRGSASYQIEFGYLPATEQAT